MEVKLLSNYLEKHEISSPECQLGGDVTEESPLQVASRF